MTVSYTGDVANASSFGCFNKILLRWRGSVYKLVFKELLAYVVMYMIINITYRIVLVPKTECDSTLASCYRWKTYSLIVDRWWKQYQLLPWPDSFAMLLVGLYKVNNDEAGRKIRRNMIRYITLSYCIALRTVSFRLKKRFPTLEHLVHAGIMRPDEFKEFQRLDEKIVANKWFLPLAWTAKLIGEGVENKAVEAPTATAIMEELCKIRGNLTQILSYDWISVPLVYTQVVTLAVYFYFIAALFGSQWVMPATEEAHSMIYKTSARLDLFYPFFLTLQFAFYIGWLKVAETLINPFGEDDDDFELNRLIDRHIQVGFLICDPIVEKPDLLKDKFWDDIIPQDMLYTLISLKEQDSEFRGSAEVMLSSGESEKIYSTEGNSLRRRLHSTETIYESIRSNNKRRSSTNFKASRKSRENSKRSIPKEKYLKTLSDLELMETYSVV